MFFYIRTPSYVLMFFIYVIYSFTRLLIVFELILENCLICTYFFKNKTYNANKFQLIFYDTSLVRLIYYKLNLFKTFFRRLPSSLAKNCAGKLWWNYNVHITPNWVPGEARLKEYTNGRNPMFRRCIFDNNKFFASLFLIIFLFSIKCIHHLHTSSFTEASLSLSSLQVCSLGLRTTNWATLQPKKFF